MVDDWSVEWTKPGSIPNDSKSYSAERTKWGNGTKQ